MQYDAIIISDLHLASKNCHANKLIRFLKKIKNKKIDTKQIILNGDIFNSWDISKLKKSHRRILKKLRKLSRTHVVTWIAGNHDEPSDFFSSVAGVEVHDEYVLHSGNKKILILHGHQFDKFITKHPVITAVADFFYAGLQIIDRVQRKVGL